MVTLAFAFNFNIQRSVIEVGEEEPIIEEGYRPLLGLLLAHGVRADLFLSGFSTLTLRNRAPDVLQTITTNLGTAFDLGTYTYTHPIPQLLLPEELARQIRKGLEIDREVFATNPQGFLPSEMAFTHDMVRLLRAEGLKWVIVLAGFLEGALARRRSAGAGGRPDRDGEGPPQAAELYRAYTAVSREVSMSVVPAAYELPGLPPRFFKAMMKGSLPVREVVEAVRRFAEGHPDALLLFKRDAETIFIDAYNSGFDGTERVFGEFLDGLCRVPEVRFLTVGEFLRTHPPAEEVEVEDYLGNTRIETFTEGEAKGLWELTKRVRSRLLAAEKRHPGSPRVEQAWEHLLLSHNSDGRIGYWHSKWNPGEHKVAASRRRFVEENLNRALELLEALEHEERKQ